MSRTFRNDDPCGYAQDWHNGTRVVTVLHLRANLDANGNPRRVFIGLDKRGHIVATSDEGYRSTPDWVRDAYDRGIYAVSIDVEVAEYRRQIERIERNRGRFALVTFSAVAVSPPYARAWDRKRAGKLRRDQYAWADDLVIVDLLDGAK